MYQLRDEQIIRLSDNASIPADQGNRDYAAYLAWLEAGNEPEIYVPPETPIDELKATKLSEINHWADQQLATITSTYPQTEIQSWDQQRAEATLIIEGGEGSTLLLDAMAEARGIDPVLLAEKVLEKAHLFESLSGQVFGQRQAWEDQLEAAITKEDVLAIELPA